MYEDFFTKLKYNLENVDYNILYEIIINIVYCNNKILRICTNYQFENCFRKMGK